MLLETLSQKFQKARSVNQTSNGYVSKVPTGTEPSGDTGTATGASVIDMGHPGALAQNGVLVVPYGVGSDNNTFSVRLIGWRLLPGTVDTLLWVPVTLCELACTLCASVGVAGRLVVATERFADTITVTKGATLSGEAPSENVVSTGDDTIAHALVDLKGFGKLELSFTTGGSATSCNALIALL